MMLLTEVVVTRNSTQRAFLPIRKVDLRPIHQRRRISVSVSHEDGEGRNNIQICVRMSGCSFPQLPGEIWHRHTGNPATKKPRLTFLPVHEGVVAVELYCVTCESFPGGGTGVWWLGEHSGNRPRPRFKNAV